MSSPNSFAPTRRYQGVDVALFFGLLILAVVLVLIMGGWMGLISRPITGRSSLPAGLEDLPPLPRPQLPPPARNAPPGEAPDDDRERWIAGASPPRRDRQFVVRKPVAVPNRPAAAVGVSESPSARIADGKAANQPSASEQAPALTGHDDPLQTIRRLLSDAEADRARLEAENAELRKQIEEFRSAASHQTNGVGKDSPATAH